MKRLLWVLVVLFVITIPAFAQDTPPENPVTFDEVNAVAGRLFCPECENIPLDKCGTQVCVDWKDEIARQLGEGRTSDEIVTDFVNRYGEHVVGIPQDPTLRNIALIAPYVLAVLCLVVGVWTFLRWRMNRDSGMNTPVTVGGAPIAPEEGDAYRSLLERDLKRE